MNCKSLFSAIAIAAVASVAVFALRSPAAVAQGQTDGAAGTGMGRGMMGSDKSGGMMRGGMMGGGMMRGGGMMGMMGRSCPMMGGGGMSMHAKGRIAFLKAELAISNAQEKVWDAYADALKKDMQSMQDMHKTMMQARTGKTPVERLDARIAAMGSRLNALKEIKPLLAALYEALSDEQKKTADQLLTRMGCMM